MDYRRISADCHLDLPWMPPELFVSEASAALRERMPYVVDGPQGPYWTTKTGKNFGFVNGVGPTGFKYVAGENGQADKMAATALYSDGEKGIRRVSDPHLRIRDMDKSAMNALKAGMQSTFEVIYWV